MWEAFIFFRRVRLILIANGSKQILCWPQASSVHAHGYFIFFQQGCGEFSQSRRALAERIQKSTVLAAGQQRARSRVFNIFQQGCGEFSQSRRALAERIQKSTVLAAGQQRARSRVFHIFSKNVENSISSGERWRSVFKKVPCWPQASSVHAHGSFIFSARLWRIQAVKQITRTNCLYARN